MNSSGIKRGVAATAISALAVTGLPFLASTASAETVADQLGPDAVAFYSQQGNALSTKADGTNTTASLVVGGGANVTSVLFQYQATSTGAAWNNIGGAVARNADGVFATDWGNPPADLLSVRAVPNTGLGNAQDVTPTANAGTAADTVELASEGALGVFQEPYTDGAGNPYAATTSELLGVTGTVSQGTTDVAVTDASHGTTGLSSDTTVETTTDTASDTFNSVVDIDGYPYSPGTDPNQIALNADAIGGGTNTDDAEGSTLYVQTIGSITASPTTQDQVNPANSEITITVLDTQGNPVAGAEVWKNGDTADGGTDTDTDGAAALLGYTDGRGQIVDDTQTTAGEFKYYVNTTDTDAYEPAVDKRTGAVTVTTYTQQLTTVDIVNDRDRSNFDNNEVSEASAVSDDFHIETLDQKGNLYDEDSNATSGEASDIEYRYIYDATGPTAPVTGAWTAAVDNGDGTWGIDDTYTGAGSYTIEARRPNVGGTGLTNATPETYTASVAEVVIDGGAQENAPVNGDHTVTGTLSNADGGLGGREAQITYSSTGDSSFAPQSEQPSGVTITGATTATAVTDASGDFAVKLSDPEIPSNVTPTPETGTFSVTNAEETASDTTPLGVSDSQTINWQEQAEVDSIDIDIDTLNTYGATDGASGGPGVPLDLDILVKDADGNDLQDFPVEVEVDAGFLSPNAEDTDDLTLADGHDEDGDVYGFFQNDGQIQNVSTGDTGDEAGVVAAIERDPGFDDDGLTDMTITVTAGDVTETRRVTMDARKLLNIGGMMLDRAAGEPAGPVPTDQDLDFQYYVHDQFDNIVGGSEATILDDSTIADFNTDGNGDTTMSDFTTSGPGVTAFSDAPTTQTLMARNSNGEYIVDAGSYPDFNNRTYSASSDPIEWVEATPERINAGLVVRGNDNGKRDDKVFANANSLTEGARVVLFRKTKRGNWRKIDRAFMNRFGNHKFKGINDKNGRKRTAYKVIVRKTDATKRGVGKNRLR